MKWKDILTRLNLFFFLKQLDFCWNISKFTSFERVKNCVFFQCLLTVSLRKYPFGGISRKPMVFLKQSMDPTCIEQLVDVVPFFQGTIGISLNV